MAKAPGHSLRRPWPEGADHYRPATSTTSGTSTKSWTAVLCSTITSLWGIEVPQVPPRFGPDQGISWQFFLALYMYEKHWKIFFCTLVCGILWHLAFTVAPLSTFLCGILRGRTIVCGPEFLVSEQNLVIFQQPVIVSCHDMALHDIYGTTLPWYHTTMVPRNATMAPYDASIWYYWVFEIFSDPNAVKSKVCLPTNVM